MDFLYYLFNLILQFIGRKPAEKRRKKKKTVLVKLLKEVVMINFYDCDKNLSETDFNEVEKN